MPAQHPAPLPDFLYGTAWKQDRTQRLTELALRMGFRGIDTANQRRHYVEAGVGQGLAAAYRAGMVTRADFFLQTKFTYQHGQDHRLPYDPAADLATQVGRRIVGQPVVLAVLVGELRLQKKIRTRHHARAVGGGEPLTDSGLDVVPPLVGGVDAPEAHPERELGEALGPVLLPGGAVEEIGKGCGMLRRHDGILPWSWPLDLPLEYHDNQAPRPGDPEPRRAAS